MSNDVDSAGETTASRACQQWHFRSMLPMHHAMLQVPTHLRHEVETLKAVDTTRRGRYLRATQAAPGSCRLRRRGLQQSPTGQRGRTGGHVASMDSVAQGGYCWWDLDW